MLNFHRNLACLLVLTTAPTLAGADTLTWGQIELKAGANHISNLDGNATSIADRNPRTYDVVGRIGADMGAFGAQLDLSYSAQDIVSDDYTGYYWGKFGAIHLNYDVSSTLALGAVYGGGQSQPADDDRANLDFYALEGAYTAGAGVYGLQFGSFDASDPDETDAFHDGSFVRLATVYTLGNGGVIDGEVAYFDGQQDSDGEYNMHAYNWGVEYSQQIGANPVAWSVGLDGGSYTNGDDDDDNGIFNETRVTLGLTAWFGDTDYASAKRRGIFSQPEFGRIVGAGNNVD